MKTENMINHIVLKSCIYRRSLFNKRMKFLPDKMQIVKHVIGTQNDVASCESSFRAECDNYVERLNKKSVRTKLDRDGNIIEPVYIMGAFITVKQDVTYIGDKMMGPIEIYV